LEICQGDIPLENTDAIVNAANSQLLHSGGVAAAISRRGGEAIDSESREWVKDNGRVTHARPAVTSGGNLACKYVIHAVGPVWGDGDEDSKLKEAIIGSLKTAEGLNARSIAFPAISTGIYGFPVDRAAEIFMRTFKEYFGANPKTIIEKVKIILFDNMAVNVFSKAFQNEFEK
jgi:O-acetyl-ADP-ribose deacetylase (regulator of RNase III)